MFETRMTTDEDRDNDRDNDQLSLQRSSSPVGLPHRKQRSGAKRQINAKRMVRREEQSPRPYLALFIFSLM